MARKKDQPKEERDQNQDNPGSEQEDKSPDEGYYSEIGRSDRPDPQRQEENKDFGDMY